MSSNGQYQLPCLRLLNLLTKTFGFQMRVSKGLPLSVDKRMWAFIYFIKPVVTSALEPPGNSWRFKSESYN